MSLIPYLKQTYGKVYGMLVLTAYLFFIALGATWFFSLFLTTKEFSYQGFILMVAFIVQIFLRKKLVNLILGILTLFFSLWSFLQVLAVYSDAARDNSVPVIVYKVGFILAVVSIILSGILIFSFYEAHKNANA